ncbi:uncharacterized protein PV09_04741 [Verruconis gallopava]|uniref:Pyridoxamine 5'-phosphate oxidase N-terminal domain-containing protein n=1 Tax=Verruconis gallopava TaxID=253628 RepID=A0A0D2AAU3_9PEZI|nr:uncharacterized protein PV09_04741 [Verruconis gallopava]KIW03898.1 hypothetical protein PV09_04741 [Verruconis gallopava]
MDIPGRSSSGLPEEVVTCLDNARFLHLATSHNDVPHVSLMKYTYLPSTPFSSSPTIIMTTPPSSRKTLNLEANPKVSLLVHDWVSHRPPTLSSSPDQARSPERSSLANLLMGFNSASISRISVSLNGTAQFLEPGSEEEEWCKARHRESNAFGENVQSDPFGISGDAGAGSYIEGQEVRVVVVKIRDGRISDWQESVKDFSVEGASSAAPLVNGV